MNDLIGFLVVFMAGALFGVVVMAALSVRAYDRGYKDARRE